MALSGWFEVVLLQESFAEFLRCELHAVDWILQRSR
jgi:hypothetical protein